MKCTEFSDSVIVDSLLVMVLSYHVTYYEHLKYNQKSFKVKFLDKLLPFSKGNVLFPCMYLKKRMGKSRFMP
jgi:hypothetical protein